MDAFQKLWQIQVTAVTNGLPVFPITGISYGDCINQVKLLAKQYDKQFDVVADGKLLAMVSPSQERISTWAVNMV